MSALEMAGLYRFLSGDGEDDGQDSEADAATRES